jgi:hypothetical protein
MASLQWAILSPVAFRSGFVQEVIRIKNRLHVLLLNNWPDCDKFYSEPFDSKATLAFWRFVCRLARIKLEKLTVFLREQSHEKQARSSWRRRWSQWWATLQGSATLTRSWPTRGFPYMVHQCQEERYDNRM